MDANDGSAAGPRVPREPRVLTAIVALALSACGCGAAASRASADDIVIAPVATMGAAPIVDAAPAPGALGRAAVRPDASRIEGAWRMDDSSARVRIRVDGGELRVRVWDSSDGDDRFEVLEATWDGARLHITMRYVPNDWTTTCDLGVKDDDTLEGERTGAATGHLIWTRMTPAEAAEDHEL